MRGKRTTMTDEDLTQAFNIVKAENPGPFKLGDVTKALKQVGFPMPEAFTSMLRKQGVCVPDGAVYSKGYMWANHGPCYKTRVLELIALTRKEAANWARENAAKKKAIANGTYKEPEAPKPKEEIEAKTEMEEDKHLIPITQAEMDAIKFLKSRGYRVTKLIVVEQIV